MKIRYIEIVTPDVAGTIKLLGISKGVEFSAPVAELGNARVSDLSDGSQIGVRAPMHDAEAPVTRTYFSTNDLQAATDGAIADGAELAVSAMELPGHGHISLFFLGGNQFGFWQD